MEKHDVSSSSASDCARKKEVFDILMFMSTSVGGGRIDNNAEAVGGRSDV